MVAEQAKLPPSALTSPRDLLGLSPNFSTSYPATYVLPGKAAEVGSSLGGPFTHVENLEETPSSYPSFTSAQVMDIGM